MDAMVTARVPVEIKKQGDRKLKQMGSSATELINDAYRYVIEHGALPCDRDANREEKGPRTKTLTGDAAREFHEKWAARSVLEAGGYDGGNFKDMLDQARGEYYARLA